MSTRQGSYVYKSQKDQYGDLAMINGREIRLTLTPPSASELKKLQKEAAKKSTPGEDEDPD